MTEIEEMWERAKEDAKHQAVNGTIKQQGKIYCQICRDVVAQDHVCEESRDACQDC